MSFEVKGRVGPALAGDGDTDTVRLTRMLGQVVADGDGHFTEAATRGTIFSLALNATTTGVAAGNIVAAAAAAATNFALWNLPSSKVNVVLLKFGMGIISGTPGAGPLFHGIFDTGVPTIASVGTARNNLVNGPLPVARFMSSAAGAALTGGIAPQLLRCAAFSTTATAQASVGEVNAVELIDGEIVLPPGTGWVPLWSAAGTALLNAYSVTWQEIAI